MLKKLQKIGLILFFYLLSVKGLYAIEYFSDEFNFKDAGKWTYLSNEGQILFNTGVMDLTSSAYYFPYVTNSAGSALKDFNEAYFEFRFNYKDIDFMGNGIGIGYTGQNGYPYYQFSIWNDSTSGPVLQYQDDDTTLGGKCDYANGLKKISLLGKVFENTWHIFRIEKLGSSYVVKLDSNIILSTGINQCIPINLLMGNPLSGGRPWWTKLSIDYVSAGGFEDNTINKVIILPGLGASWNPVAMLSGSTSPIFGWTMTPFVKNYELLISGLESNGLVKNQDFFVWNYDWRKPLEQIVNDFNNYVSSLNLTADEKINLVGHSLGGVVARVWTQDNPLRVEQTITLGSPHYGSLKAYEAWNGAKISDSVDIASIALNVFMQLQKKNFDTTVQTLRNYAPIVFDLSPTFTFLKRNGLNVTTNSSQYLVSKNNLVSTIGDKLLTIDGIGVGTKEWINLGERSLFDKVLGIWEEGRPLSYLNGVGDGTVLKKSALIAEADQEEFNSSHGEIVDKSVNMILNRLDLGVTVNQNISYPQKQVVYYLGSPATMSVNCGENPIQDIDGWVMITDKDLSSCQVNLTGKDGGGTYHLVSGDGQSWNYFEGEINDGETKNVDINEIENRWMMLKKSAMAIGATNLILPIDQKNIVISIDEYLKFRRISKVFKNSEEIIDNLNFILNRGSYSATEINKIYLKAKASKSLVETNLRLLARSGKVPSYSASINYEQANNLMKEGKNYGANYLANKLYEIVWK
ncbi:MAG TPA: alpha/beta fold hydrolase [Candidatus Woesebacteria bacterium]|nr:alpha/beta fold hydrolase [Candidatus Woesebacteria bacterium]HPR99658.1 alpha/beta fold hydrolase [Candidatus Woesebacteria bacterium]